LKQTMDSSCLVNIPSGLKNTGQCACLRIGTIRMTVRLFVHASLSTFAAPISQQQLLHSHGPCCLSTLSQTRLIVQCVALTSSITSTDKR
jgi:hypothetical protein